MRFAACQESRRSTVSVLRNEPATAITEQVCSMAQMRPSIRPTETYTESNFLRVHTTPAQADANGASVRIATIEHLASNAGSNGGGLLCQTIVDGEEMTKDDALFIARNYAAENGIPVIYECHSNS